MNKKILIIVALLLAAGGGGYFFVLKKPAAPAAKSKVHGVAMPMDPDFLLNLNDGHMAKFHVTLMLKHDDPALSGDAPAAAASGGGGAAAGPLVHPNNNLIRTIITDEVTDTSSEQILDRHGREKLAKRIRKQIHRKTDAKVEEVLISDLVVD